VTDASLHRRQRCVKVYNPGMIRLWKLTGDDPLEIALFDQSSLDSITLLLQDGYYTTFRTYDSRTRVLGFKSHLTRLPELDVSFLRRNLIRLLEYFQSDEVRVRLILTKDKELYIAIEPLHPLPIEVYEAGIHTITMEIRRRNPRIKSTKFIGESSDERRFLARTGAFEALMIKNGRILEGMTSNFFYVLSGILCTSARDVLPGVTRRTVVRVARNMGIKVRYGQLKLEQLSVIREAFLTSSSRGVVPIIQIDSTAVADGISGPMTQRLIRAYDAYVKTHSEKI